MEVRTRLFLAMALLVGLLVQPAGAAPREGADHYEFYFPSGDGITTLHADVLRKTGVDLDVKQPVILTVSPYTNHTGATTPSPGEINATGPSPRFYDFLDASDALNKGYTYVMVDLPGDGGSGGCNDWGGVREQGAVKAAVEWAAEQPWSTGKVALLGKSYDGWTGLMGVAQQPKGLAAVISLEPVYSGYRYIWMNGVRRSGTWPYGYAFTAVDAMPGRPAEPEYVANSAPEGYCYPVNIAGQNVDTSEDGPYWAERNLLPTARGKKTPVFLTQGFLETNTKPDGAFQYFNGLSGKNNRAWFGQFDHCRAWEMQKACDAGGEDTSMAVGRDAFIDEVMRFLDLHLKGIKSKRDPAVEVQDAMGRWRAEASWPPSDSRAYETKLRTGSYTDDGSGSGTAPSDAQGIWSVSSPLTHDVWFSGEPILKAELAPTAPIVNVAANVYDIDPKGEVTMISRGVQNFVGPGPHQLNLRMYGQDWPILEGHRIGVLISGADNDEFLYEGTASFQAVAVSDASIALPFLTFDRTKFLAGKTTPRLEEYLKQSTATLSKNTIKEAQTPFKLPAELRTRN
ncbi:MAG: uncharacterized protein QOG54_1555 [Actinomycetota bacterium]|nr:uncharacterized protein [Actinomycetota bacterium]